MTIKYTLEPNRLTPDPNDFKARVRQTGSIDLDGLAQRIVEQGTTVTLPDVLAVLENTIQAAESFLLQGYRINLGGLCELFARLRGRFAGIDDSFDPARHRVTLGANAGERINRTFRQSAAVQKLESITPAPALLTFVDEASGGINSSFTSANIGTINGHRLSFDESQADEGIYFVDTADGTEYKATLVQKNKPGQLVFLNPTIAPGTTVELEVRSRFGTELRSGKLAAAIPL